MTRARATAAALVVLVLSGTASPVSAQAPLETYWPHTSGARWTYDRVEIIWGAASKARYTAVQFVLGEVRNLAGVDVQPLEVTTSNPTDGSLSAFGRQLVIARPGTRRRVVAWEAGRTQGETSGLVIHDARLVHIGGDAIAAYRDAPVLRSWIYMLPAPTTGQTFHLQLVPDLADSVFLDGRVLGSADVSTPGGSFASAVRVQYDIDYGWNDATDDMGHLLGRVRSHTRGEMFWVSNVGPVLARETFVTQAEVQGSPPPASADSSFAELRLQSFSLTPSAVQSANWGDVKRLYRVPH